MFHSNFKKTTYTNKNLYNQLITGSHLKGLYKLVQLFFNEVIARSENILPLKNNEPP
jgi:hypothetical protein